MKSKLLKKLIDWIVLCVIILVLLVPILWLICTSFKTTRDIIVFPPKFVFKPTLSNYKELARLGLFSGLKHSLIIGIATSILTFILGTPFSYILSRYSFKKRETKDSLRFWILSLRLMPPIVIIIPFILLWFKLKLLDTYFAIIVTYLTFSLPLFIWLSIESYKVIPSEVEEAAFLEGLSQFKVFFKISFPIAMRGLISTLIFTFLFIWNEFFFVFALSSKLQTLPLLVASHAQAAYTAPWGTLSAFTIALSIPTLILVFVLFRFMRRYFIINL